MTFFDVIIAGVRSLLWRVKDWINRLRRAALRLKGTNAENCLSLQTTEVAEILRRKWNQEKNGEITPADIAHVFSRYAGCGCPECARVRAAWTRRLKKDKFQLQLFK